MSLVFEEKYQRSFLVKSQDYLVPVKSQDIAYFFARGNSINLVTMDNREFSIDNSLTELEKVLNPNSFFRLNRNFIAHVNSIERLVPDKNGKVLVRLNIKEDQSIPISQKKTRDLKVWINQVC